MSTKRNQKRDRKTSKANKARLAAFMRLHSALAAVGYTVNLKPVNGGNVRLIELAA